MLIVMIHQNVINMLYFIHLALICVVMSETSIVVNCLKAKINSLHFF